MGLVRASIAGVESTHLSNEHEEDQSQTNPRAINPKEGPERDFIERVSVVRPRSAESNVGQADGSPSEECSQTRQSQKPREDRFAAGTKANVCDGTEHEDEDGREQRTTGLIYVSEKLGCVALFGECSKSARSTKNSRVPNGDDRDQDDDVHEAVKADQTGIFRGNHKRRSLAVAETRSQKSFIRVLHQEANE